MVLVSRGKLIRKISDSWMHRVPAVTTPIGSEGMYLQTLDHNWAIQRLRNENKDEFGDRRFYKPVIEPLKLFNKNIVDFYTYDNPEKSSNGAKNVSFGGLFNNFSKLNSRR